MGRVIDNQYIVANRSHAPLKVGSIVRNRGNGAHLMRVVSITPDAYDYYGRRTYSEVMLEGYGFKVRGVIKYSQRPKKIRCWLSSSTACREGANTTWVYEHVELANGTG